MGKLLAEAPPPGGRRNRKVREHHDDIVKLRAKGYTLRDIQAALVEVVGVRVGTSTIQRELARAKKQDTPARVKTARKAPKAGNQAPEVGQRRGPRSTPSAPTPTAASPAGRSPQERADAFMASLNTNPLLKPRSKT